MNDEEIRFEDGNVTAVARVGVTVRCSVGPWMPAVHALLRYLEARGFDVTYRLRSNAASGSSTIRSSPWDREVSPASPPCYGTVTPTK